jgi:hypothetical protein
MHSPFFSLKAASILFFLLAHLLLQYGCSQPTASSSQQEVQEAVRLYTQLLADGYRKMNMNMLPLAATAERVKKTYLHMAAFGEGQVRMDSQLRKMEFVSTQFSATDRAEVQTKESWDYAYYKINNNEKAYENSVTYHLSYHLMQDSGTWLVDDITIMQSEEGEGSGEISFLTRPDNFYLEPSSPGSTSHNRSTE